MEEDKRGPFGVSVEERRGLLALRKEEEEETSAYLSAACQESIAAYRAIVTGGADSEAAHARFALALHNIPEPSFLMDERREAVARARRDLEAAEESPAEPSRAEEPAAEAEPAAEPEAPAE